MKYLIFCILLYVAHLSMAEKVYKIEKTMSGGKNGGYDKVQQGSWHIWSTGVYQCSITCNDPGNNPCLVSSWPSTALIPPNILENVKLSFQSFIAQNDYRFENNSFSNNSQMYSFPDEQGGNHLFNFTAHLEGEKMVYELFTI